LKLVIIHFSFAFILFGISKSSLNTSNNNFSNIKIAQVRLLYKDAITSKEKAALLYDKLKKITKKDNKILLAYKGAVTALVSKNLKGAKTKKATFKEGILLIEYAVSKQPKAYEIRFIRMCLQQNIPKFLKYNKHKVEDKNFILNNFKTLKSNNLKRHVLDYINQSKHFTELEKNRLNSK